MKKVLVLMLVLGVLLGVAPLASAADVKPWAKMGLQSSDVKPWGQVSLSASDVKPW